MHSSEAITDDALAKAAQSGDAAAWAVLVQRCWPAVMKYARWRCAGKANVADDVLQEAWLTAAQHLGKYRNSRGCFTAWVCGLVANAARRAWRTQKRYITVPLDDVPCACGEDAGVDAERVAVVLSNLSESEEQLLRWKYYDGKSVAEIAHRLRKSEKAVESALTRARHAFRQAMPKHPEGHV